MPLRPAQEQIMDYRGGRMAVSAVPGSGKTFTLSLLAANLIESSRVDVAEGQQVLIVTYLNASVDHFKAQIRRWLQEAALPIQGFDVRTLHSLALEIVRNAAGSGASSNESTVLDEIQGRHFLQSATNAWIETHPELWHTFLPEPSVAMKARWREITERVARVYIRAAKNERFRPDQIQHHLTQQSRNKHESYALLWMLNGIYARYQTVLSRQGALDFDDLVWEAVDLMQQRPDLALATRQRWPFVLEDEAQDSVPLQAELLAALTGKTAGNWVRVGDPNQAITSTFTAAHPRHFNDFIDLPGVKFRPLPNSGRSAPLIMGAANALLHWVCDHHPLPEVRQAAFRRQDILPTPPGDAQPNPPDEEAGLRIQVYGHREEEELPDVARLAHAYTQKYPQRTVAVLTPTNNIGHALSEHLDTLGAAYDNLLRGGGREREIASALYGLIGLLADPLDVHLLVQAHKALFELGHPVAGPAPEQVEGTGLPDRSSAMEDSRGLQRFYAMLHSVRRPEQLLFPREQDGYDVALPTGVATPNDLLRLEIFLTFVRRVFSLRTLPVDDLVLALADELFASGLREASDLDSALAHLPIREADLSIAHGIAAVLRRWRDLQPEWRLPELAAALAEVAGGRRSLPLARPSELGYEPQAGRVTLATQHGAKGLEWDGVFLVGIDNSWIPGDLEAPFLGIYDFLGGDPTAEAVAQLRFLMADDAGLFSGRSATESAHIEIICERLRLLYVGITRTRRFLQISRSRLTRRFNQNWEAEPATALGVLYRYLQGRAAA